MGDAAANTPRRFPPLTLLIGAGMIVGCAALLAVDVHRRGGIVLPADQPLPAPVGALGQLARRVAGNMTVLCWVGYLFFFDGLLEALSRGRPRGSGSPIRVRPNRFIVAWLTSIPVWCFFDWLNFYYLDAWRYHHLPPGFARRLAGYFLAFAAISPGMFLAAELYQRLGVRRLRHASKAAAWFAVIGVPAVIALITLALLTSSDEPRMILGSALLLLGPALAALVRNRTLLVTAFAVGVGFTAWALLVRDPIGCMTLWVGLIYLLDPINAKLGAPSLLRDWQAGRWGRTTALCAGGATCGLLWELWNYWAIAKWTYHLPFMGWMEEVRYFEMPWPGFAGFLPFACECWVMLNTVVALLSRVGLRVAEPLPDDDTVI